MFDVNGDNILDIVPDSEGISNPNYNGLKRFWGLYYRGIPGGTFEIDYFDPDQINNFFIKNNTRKYLFLQEADGNTRKYLFFARSRRCHDNYLFST